MKIIIGLGNPGKQYEKTRHNIGFALLDQIKEDWGFPDFTLNKKFNAEISEQVKNGVKVILAKPQTFMNLSGTTARSILDFYKLSPSDFFIIQDELDLPIGTYKVATNSSAAGHNGIKNIIEQLGTQQFQRLRVGIGTDKQDASCLLNAHDFVLNAFTNEERLILQQTMPEYKKEIEAFVL